MSLTYEDALDYLYGFINYELKRHDRYSPDVIRLDRPRELAELLGNPQDSYPALHITGTKGKGSVGAMCATALQQAGLRTGLYTSPHLQDFRERIRVDGEVIPKGEMVKLVEAMRDAVAQVPGLTWFEVITILAFLYFAEVGVDAAVIEVGLGGRLDATNIITPVVSVITSLSYDHTYLLGSTLADIAREKAGIIKPGVPVVSAPQPPEALEVLESVAAERGSRLILIGRDWTFEMISASPAGQKFQAGPIGGPQGEYWTPLLGAHQVVNATVALAAMDVANGSGQLLIPSKARREGLRRVNWPGRLEVIGREPWLILDAAHNEASALRLRAALDDLFPHERSIIVFGASEDKDIRSMFAALLPGVQHLILTQAVHPRALDPDNLAEAARDVGFGGEIETVVPVSRALRRALKLAGQADLICATGSLFVVGEVREACGLDPTRAAYLAAQAPCPQGIGSDVELSEVDDDTEAESVEF